MKVEDHLQKARRVHETVKKLDPEEDWELVVEGVYGAAIQYIAYISQRKIGEHKESHRGLPKFLEDNGLSEIAEKFRVIDLQRQKHWYGGQSDGDVSERVLSILGFLDETASSLERGE